MEYFGQDLFGSLQLNDSWVDRLGAIGRLFPKYSKTKSDITSRPYSYIMEVIGHQ